MHICCCKRLCFLPLDWQFFILHIYKGGRWVAELPKGGFMKIPPTVTLPPQWEGSMQRLPWMAAPHAFIARHWHSTPYRNSTPSMGRLNAMTTMDGSSLCLHCKARVLVSPYFGPLLTLHHLSSYR